MALALSALVAAGLTGIAQAQSNCLSLAGSTACSQFSSLYVNPSSLASLYPFLSSVTDVSSFDTGLLNYLNTTFKTTKYNQELGCTNTSSDWVLQYAQTFLCGEMTTRSYAAGCTNVPYQRMTCQATCLQFAVSENLLVSSATACGTTNTAGAARQGNLTYDFTTCTDWTSLISNNTATCALGQLNEGNCGFGTSTSQLCDYCNPSNKGGQLVNSCCIGSTTNLGSCGYTLALNQVAASPTASSVNPSATQTSSTSSAGGGAAGAGSDNTGSSSSSSGSSGLSGGAIAGIVIGSIVGVLLLAALALFCLARRRRNGSASDRRGQSGLLAGAAGSSGYDHEKGALSKEEAFAAKQKRIDLDTPPSPMSSGTLGFSGRDSEDSRAMLGSGKSSPSLTTAAAGALAGYSVGSAMRGEGERPISQDTSNTGSSNERNLVPSVRDQYSSADIVPGSEVVAIYAYEPNLPDELKLQPDAVVTVRKIYDDGWAIGSHTASDGTVSEGAFPLVVCTVVGADSDRDSSNSSYMVTASEAGGNSLARPGRTTSSSRRGSSIGDTSFESAPSHAPTHSSSNTQKGGVNTAGGIFGSFFRRSTSQSHNQ